MTLFICLRVTKMIILKVNFYKLVFLYFIISLLKMELKDTVCMRLSFTPIFESEEETGDWSFLLPPYM